MITALFELLAGIFIQGYIFLAKIILAGLTSIPIFVYLGIAVFFILKYLIKKSSNINKQEIEFNFLFIFLFYL